MNNRTLNGRDSAENSSTEDIGSRSSGYESVATADENQGNVSDATGFYDDERSCHCFDGYIMQVQEAAAENREFIPDYDLQVLLNTFGFGSNYRPYLGTVDGVVENVVENVGSGASKPRKPPVLKVRKTSKRVACPKKSRGKSTKRRCSKPKSKAAKTCSKPKANRACPKPKRKPVRQGASIKESNIE